jgi:CTP:molybdopterin cytidylyltransferase MocA
MILALLPAAGLSIRMGRPKLALPLGGKTVLEQVLLALRTAALDHILVVLGPQVANLSALAEQAGALVLVLDQETPDMRATVQRGLRWLEERFHPRPEDQWLLVPADHPALDPQVIRDLMAQLMADTAFSIAVPSHGGKRGHPTLLSWKHVAQLPAHPRGQGINGYLHERRAETLEVPVASDSILLDLDTPTDYRNLLERWGSSGAAT